MRRIDLLNEFRDWMKSNISHRSCPVSSDRQFANILASEGRFFKSMYLAVYHVCCDVFKKYWICFYSIQSTSPFFQTSPFFLRVMQQYGHVNFVTSGSTFSFRSQCRQVILITG
ncbi:hypothetical protein GTNG_1323 [Geobacillus thermodenitrificans NG80-2]|uniref:Uncharacterized protein n=1 Tax=Geobacillus thermodenitrificans (strain NG80-2) TaxID=420246 RepID=A4IMY9_GEOTN|nr:hypothetical protein GTNG_1323 [Geobacillus thermodenitrificans NG80-2]